MRSTHPGIARPRLIDALRANASGPVSFVTAPLGSGTSTVLRQWCEAESGDGGALLFDANILDANDAQPERIPVELRRLLALDGSPENVGDPAVIRPGIVIVDHADVLTDVTIQSIVEAVVARPGLPHLVLAGRRMPSTFRGWFGTTPPPRLSGSDLWFDHEELRRLAEEMGGVNVPDEKIERMAEITGGWPLAVTALAFDIGWPHRPIQMEADRLGRPRCPSVLLPIVDDLLDSMDESERFQSLGNAILRTSVFDWIDDERLAVVVGPSAGITLERLRELPLPMVPGLEIGRWGLHPVIGSRAEERMRIHSPDVWAEVVRAAGRHHVAEGDYAPAIDCFVAAGAESELISLLTTGYFDVLASGVGPRLLEELHGISHETKLAEPMGLILYGLLHRHVGDERGAQTVWAALYSERLGGGRALHEVSSAVALVMALGIGYGRTTDEVIGAYDSAMKRFAIRRDGTRPDPSFVVVDDAELLFELPWHLDPTTVLGFLHAARAEASLHLGKRAEAREFLAQGHRLANRDARTLAVFESVEAAIEARAGNLVRAETIAGRVLGELGALAAVLPGIDPRLTLAEIALTRGDVEQASAFVDAAEHDAGAVAAVTRLAQAVLIRTGVHLAMGEPRRGLDLLESGSRDVLRHLPDRLERRRHRLTVHLHIAAGDIGGARRLVERGDGPLTSEFDVLVAYAIAIGNDRLLRMAVDNRTASADPIDRVVWLAAGAQLGFRVGDTHRVLDRLRALAPIVTGEGLLQPILDVGIVLPELLDTVGDEPELRGLRRFLGDRTVAVHFAGVRFTERERQVLEAIANFVTDEELAACLGVSTNTVKTHRRSLYRKLKASSQGEAVRRGEQLGLLAARPSMFDGGRPLAIPKPEGRLSPRGE